MPFWVKNSVSWAISTLLHGIYCIFHWVNFANLQNHAQKQRIWRENCKYAFDENFHRHFCSRRKATKFCLPVHYILLYLQYVLYDTSHTTACIRWSPPSRAGQSKRKMWAMLEVREALFVSVYNSCTFQSFCWGLSSLIKLITCLGGAPANIPPRKMTKQESQALTALQSFDSSSSYCCFPR